MGDSLRIVIAQMNQRVGDLASNAAAIVALRAQYSAADLIVCPEMQLVGYPPEDLVLKPALVLQAERMLAQLAESTSDGGPALLVGSVVREQHAPHAPHAPRMSDSLYNSVTLLDTGRIVAQQYKYHLPNYGTFDDQRLFAPGPMPKVIEFRGARLGVLICEDGWTPDVCAALARQGAEILIAVNASPYEAGKNTQRLQKIFAARVAETGLPLIFVNRVGGQDELAFDGSSFVLNKDGSLAHRLPNWDVASRDTHWHRLDPPDSPEAGRVFAAKNCLEGDFNENSRKASARDGFALEQDLAKDTDSDTKADDTNNFDRVAAWHCRLGAHAVWDSPPADVYHAMMVALRDYVDSAGFSKVILGLSGGIDSAVCAAIVADALGADRLWAVMLPSRYTSQASLDDAAACAAMVGCRYDIISITPAVEAFTSMLAAPFAGQLLDSSEENIQSRTRAVTLMGLANKFKAMLLTTGNKSELSVGYATLYGDMAGGYNPIKDVYKSDVFALAHWRNRTIPRLSCNRRAPVIAAPILTKAPSAELRPDQKDSDSLPPYAQLDAMLRGLVEEDKTIEDLVKTHGFDHATLAHVEGLLRAAEHKRHQAPPGVKLSPRNFGRDRRYPIMNHFKSTESDSP